MDQELPASCRPGIGSTRVTDVEEALSRIPLWNPHDVQFAELDGGLSNRSFKLEWNGNLYVLRIAEPACCDTRAAPDSEAEVHAQAAAAGIAPDILYSNIDEGILVTTFIDAAVWTVDDLEARTNLEAIAALLRRVHELPAIGVEFNAHAAAQTYLDKLCDQSALREFAQHCVRAISETNNRGPVCCCHNDIVVDNIIGLANPKLIDWEYACDNNPLFDLASLICYHDLDDERANVLLQAYSAGLDLSDELQQQTRIFDALQWLWLACRQVGSPGAGQAARLRLLQDRIS